MDIVLTAIYMYIYIYIRMYIYIYIYFININILLFVLEFGELGASRPEGTNLCCG